MSKAKQHNHVTIQRWMCDLQLSASELIVYALVCENEQTDLSITDIQEWIGGRRNVTNILNKLLNKGLITKTSSAKGKSNQYTSESSAKIALLQKLHYCKNCNSSSAKFAPVVVQKLHTPNIDNINNNINNNSSSSSEAHAHTHEEDFEIVLEWLTDNEDGLEQVLCRNKLITYKMTKQEMVEIIRPYAQEYYKQQLMNGGDDIQRRGRRDIKTHFTQWLPKHLKRQQEELNPQNQTGNGKQSNSVAQAMQHLVEGMENARRSQV